MIHLEPFTLNDLVEATSTGGRFRFLVSGSSIKRACLLCEATFEQSDEGLRELHVHQFGHGMASLFDWSEIDGKALRMVVVQGIGGQRQSKTTDVYGVDDAENVVYHLTHLFRYNEAERGLGSWKWKTTNQTPRGNGPTPTRFAPASPSNG